MQRNYEVKLGKLVDGKFVETMSKTVREFDDDCLSANLYGDAVAAFEDYLEDKVIFELNDGLTKEYVRYNADTGNGTVIRITC